MPRSSVYALLSADGGDGEPGKRGPTTELSDEALVVEIRTVLSEGPFMGEGHRKVRARLGAPVRRERPRGDRSHGGRIRTERPDELWGTDAARFWTRRDG